jgi:hypothetical protein
MHSIEIEAIGTSQAEAAQIAQELRQALREAGVNPRALSLARDRHDTMGLEWIVVLAQAAWPYLDKGLVALGVANAIYDIFIRERCALRIKTDKGVFEIGPGEIEVEKLRAILAAAGDDATKP